MKDLLSRLIRNYRWLSVAYIIIIWFYLIGTRDGDMGYRYVIVFSFTVLSAIEVVRYARNTTHFWFHSLISVNLVCYILAIGVDGTTFAGFCSILVACLTSMALTINALRNFQRN